MANKNQEPFELCDRCGKPIQYGNACVTLNRNIEQVDWSEELEDAEITVIDSDQILTLCADCGNKLDVDNMRIPFLGKIDSSELPGE